MIGIIVVGLGIAAALYMLRPRDPVIKVVQVHIKGFSVRTQVMPIPAVLVDLEVSMDVLCKNKNPVPISCSEALMDIVYEGQKLGTGDVPFSEQPGCSSRIITIPGKISSIAALGTLGPKLLSDIANREVKLTGIVTLKGIAKVGAMMHRFNVGVNCDVVIDPLMVDVVRSSSECDMDLFPTLKGDQQESGKGD
jgi:hypothetical protein